MPVAEAVRQFLAAKARLNRSDRYLRALRVSLGAFVRGRARRPLESITIEEIEAWTRREDWSERTRYGYLSDVRVWLNWCQRRGWLPRNPAEAVEIPKPACIEGPGIHSPDQVKQVLAVARSVDSTLTRSMAVRYFAGLRSAEVHRLVESEIRTGQGFIEVPASKAKTRQRRLVTIQPNLRAWLDLGGKLPLHDVSNRMRAFVHKLAAKDLPWPHNVTRHSFCSYHLAQFQNAGKTALEAGHSEQMLFAHYRELVPPDQASAFWQIVPETP